MSDRPYNTEAELCTAFAEVARAAGLVVYPEVEGWDLVLVGPEGVQIGIQAKLGASWLLLHQATEPRMRYPDHRAILVPTVSHKFRALAGRLGLLVYCDSTIRLATRWGDKMRFPTHAGAGKRGRLELPSVVPVNVVAGSPSPRSLTPWREGMLLVCAALEAQGRVSGRQVKRAGLRVSSLTMRNWLRRTGWTRSRHAGAIYERGREALPDAGWEEEKRALWMARGHVLGPFEDDAEEIPDGLEAQSALELQEAS
jgi:hypothetical protein